MKKIQNLQSPVLESEVPYQLSESSQKTLAICGLEWSLGSTSTALGLSMDNFMPFAFLEEALQNPEREMAIGLMAGLLTDGLVPKFLLKLDTPRSSH